ncbi:YCII-related protein [Kribbella flavida DSM 17836]|uniref:YCII-related protein n=1 Tax=Kribbella flavida (strain DSM 17836 / JCM 10339 / NBRC 14399) TaxID=479435 RepID=D2PPZ8_KRIFD|nr:YciI family protein [Kribbella flavida]ADB32922.1 YCII-related protein [Kribbella flavida DSM 17836]
MRYVLLIWHGEEHSEPPEEIGAWPEHQAWLADLETRGLRQGGARLRPAATTKVQVRDGEILVSDGPYAETKDLIGGFVLIDCEHLDEALEVAAGHPFAKFGTVEVRPVWE